eukprot:10390934-Ditylum_brightwellii.AAC.1
MEKCNSVLEKKTAKFETLTKETNVEKVEFKKRTELKAELVGQIENFGMQLHDCKKWAKHWESEIAKLHEFDFSGNKSADE